MRVCWGGTIQSSMSQFYASSLFSTGLGYSTITKNYKVSSTEPFRLRNFSISRAILNFFFIYTYPYLFTHSQGCSKRTPVKLTQKKKKNPQRTLEFTPLLSTFLSSLLFHPSLLSSFQGSPLSVSDSISRYAQVQFSSGGPAIPVRFYQAPPAPFMAQVQITLIEKPF